MALKINAVHLPEAPPWYPYSRIEAKEGIEIWQEGINVHVRFSGSRYGRIGHIVLSPHAWQHIQVEDEPVVAPATKKAG